MYISKRANIKTNLVGDAVIFGPSIVGEGSIIDGNVTIGYPIRSTLKRIGKMSDMDELSTGSIIGRNCILRSGTIIYEESTLGDNVETGHNVLIREKTEIGNGTRIGTATVIDGTVKIGSGVSIQSMVYIPIGSIIGNNVFIGPNVVITNDRYPPSKRLDGVIIEDNAAIGANSTLIAGIRIGAGSMVAAGSVVTKDVPPNVVVAGSPARVIYDRATYLEKQKKYEASSNQTH